MTVTLGAPFSPPVPPSCDQRSLVDGMLIISSNDGARPCCRCHATYASSWFFCRSSPSCVALSAFWSCACSGGVEKVHIHVSWCVNHPLNYTLQVGNGGARLMIQRLCVVHVETCSGMDGHTGGRGRPIDSQDWSDLCFPVSTQKEVSGSCCVLVACGWLELQLATRGLG